MDCQNPEFKILDCQNLEFKILEGQNPEFKMDEASDLANDVNKTDSPNTTPTARAICTFALYFSVFRPFCRSTLVYEGHFVLCYKEKSRDVRSC